MPDASAGADPIELPNGSGRSASTQGNAKSPTARYLRLLAICLCGYAVAGKGFAYIGYAPIYIGEAVLLAGLVVTLKRAPLRALFGDVCIWPIALYMIWGAFRTVPGIGAYGTDALRDAVIWGYATFVFIVAGLLMSDFENPRIFVRYLSKLLAVFLAVIPFSLAATYLVAKYVPVFPGTAQHIIDVKLDDAAVHLTGAGSMMMLGLLSFTPFRIVSLLVSTLFAVAGDRGGALGMAVSVAMIVVLAPIRRNFFRAIVLMLAIFAFLYVTNISIDITNDRSISARQIGNNVVSLFSSTHVRGRLTPGAKVDRDTGTIIWRLIFWNFLIDKTMDTSPMEGLGFGMSLGSLPGMPIVVQEDLRSPHNGAVTIFTRTGFIGLGLWFFALLVWYVEVFRAFLDSRKNGHYVWSSVLLVIPAYFTTALISLLFDVYLEGPMGGIWFWCLIGAGIGMRRWYWACPQYWDTPSAVAQQGDGSTLSVAQSAPG